MLRNELNKLYQIPWSALNNANGWIEPTTHCQLKCPGCYRGLAREDHVAEHLDIDSLKEQVDFLVTKRNVQTVSIAGGEPLLYPDLDALVAYIHSKGVIPLVLTNGLLLDEDRIKTLKGNGVSRFVIHLDRFQQREDGQDEAAVNKLRSKFCDLFRKIAGVQLGFIMPVSTQSLSDLDVLAPFFIKNADIVSSITFTVYRNGLAAKEPAQEQYNGVDTILSEIKRAFGLEYCAYIPKLYSRTIGWIYALTLYRDNRPWKRITADSYEMLQNRYLQSCGKYLFTPSTKLDTPHGVHSQTIVVVNLPVLTEKGWDLCKGCPDAMLFEGKLIPSCLLEQVKQGENIQVL